MFKQIFASMYARLLRASIARIVTDLELVQSLQAAYTSAPLISQLMRNAAVCRSRESVMDVALTAVHSANVGDGFFANSACTKANR